MKKFIVVLVIVLFFGGKPFGVNYTHAESNVTIAIDSLNVREGPGLSYRVVKQVKKGERFMMVKEEKDWIQIKLSNNQYGWVANWLIKKEDGPNKAVQKLGTITADSLRVRNGPGLNFQTIASLNKGNQVQILESNENWMKISLHNNVVGWISDEFVTSSNGQAPSPETNKNGTVFADSLNVRNEASLESAIIGKLKNGDKVLILSTKQDWIQIEYRGQKAWVSSEFINITTEATTTNPINSENKPTPTKPPGLTGTVTANALNVRSIGDLTGNIVGNVGKGDSFVILEEKNNWIKIEFSPNKFGWVNSWYLEMNKSNTESPSVQGTIEGMITVLNDGTNIRSGPSVENDVILRANKGEQFSVINLKGEWYGIKLNDGTTGFIAGWIVSVNGAVPQVEKPGAEAYLKNSVIVLDPGHGGGDNGTTGARGTLEKELTLRTALLLYDKLRAAGANVILTRTNDTYFSLRSRVSTAQYHRADAFLSIHYDSILDRSVRGMTTYYYHGFQRPLAEAIHGATLSQTNLKDRGARFGDYHVIRENSQKAVLIELGYLSNPAEEATVTSPAFQEMAATGIFNGLAKYFKSE
ncbi:SH3 domain-containing protein [Pseudoneobacillus sp. C159]